MVSRVGLIAILVAAGIAVSGTAARTPPAGTAMFFAEHDPRLCPSPLCGGYWASLANGVRTRCGDGQRQARCYAARAVDRYGRPYVNEIPEGSLVRGAIELGQRFGDRTLDQLRVYARGRFATTPDGGRVFRALRLYLRAPQPRA